MEYFYLAKDLYEANQAKNKEIMRVVNDALIDLKSHVYKEIIENPDKEKIVDFNKQQKGGRLKILNPKKKLNDRQ